jgi:hypothetical protein
VPELTLSAQSFIRAAYGGLMLATLLQAVPNAPRFFVSERWRGYSRSSPVTDIIQNPVTMPVVLAVWMAAAASIVLGWASPWPALVNLLFCRYFFIQMRWKSVLRGMGAPGFMAYWMGLVVFLLEYAQRSAPELRPLVLLVLQVDFALIMLSAGIYKFSAGYPLNQGMELGLCNPMWGYWWRWYTRKPPNSPVFWAMNQLAWTTEVTLALMMLVPPTRELGGLLLIVSFAFILTQIRLGFLCEMVILAGLLYVQPGGVVDGWIANATGAVSAPAVQTSAVLDAVNGLLGAALWLYLVLLPLAHAGLYYNFYARRPLPPLLQRALDRYTNVFGIILWRVFSVDLVNFFIRLWRQPKVGGARVAAGRLGSWPRFNHVGEMICLTSLFTTLKYYPSNDAIFHERLLRYARTLRSSADEILVFEYVSIARRERQFEWVPVAEYHVDVESGRVTEHVREGSLSTRAAHAVSPVHEGAAPGSYAPASR